MVTVALLSNPSSTGNRDMLPRIRSFCAGRADIFHYEVERAGQIGEALKTIARVQPKVIVVNGGDGTVQTVLTELYLGHYFEGAARPPVAVLPNGKTNLIALDLGASTSDVALARIKVQAGRVAHFETLATFGIPVGGDVLEFCAAPETFRPR